MRWILPQNRKLRHTLTLLCAMCLATAATWASHRWVERRDIPRRFYSFGTLFLNGLLGLPIVDPYFEPEGLEERPYYAAFCRRVAERARPYLRDPAARYEVWMVGTDPCRGFPFISRDWVARVYVDEMKEHEPRFTQYHFTAGQDGNSPILYGGLVGNWLFYLAISAAMLYAAEKAVTTIIIRRQQRRHGFPVVMDNEEGT